MNDLGPSCQVRNFFLKIWWKTPSFRKHRSIHKVFGNFSLRAEYLNLVIFGISFEVTWKFTPAYTVPWTDQTVFFSGRAVRDTMCNSLFLHNFRFNFIMIFYYKARKNDFWNLCLVRMEPKILHNKLLRIPDALRRFDPSEIPYAESPVMLQLLWWSVFEANIQEGVYPII
jgi:hypothetical protein